MGWRIWVEGGCFVGWCDVEPGGAAVAELHLAMLLEALVKMRWVREGKRRLLGVLVS